PPSRSYSDFFAGACANAAIAKSEIMSSDVSFFTRPSCLQDLRARDVCGLVVGSWWLVVGGRRFGFGSPTTKSGEAAHQPPTTLSPRKPPSARTRDPASTTPARA